MAIFEYGNKIFSPYPTKVDTEADEQDTQKDDGCVSKNTTYFEDGGPIAL